MRKYPGQKSAEMFMIRHDHIRPAAIHGWKQKFQAFFFVLKGSFINCFVLCATVT